MQSRNKNANHYTCHGIITVWSLWCVLRGACYGIISVIWLKIWRPIIFATCLHDAYATRTSTFLYGITGWHIWRINMTKKHFSKYKLCYFPFLFKKVCINVFYNTRCIPVWSTRLIQLAFNRSNMTISII